MFFCHLRSPGTYVPDADGFDCPDLRAAAVYAQSAARELASSPRYSRLDLAMWAFEVESLDERTTVVVPFRASGSPRLGGLSKARDLGPSPSRGSSVPVFQPALDLSVAAADLTGSLLNLSLGGPRLLGLVLDFMLLPPRSPLAVRVDVALFGRYVPTRERPRVLAPAGW